MHCSLFYQLYVGLHRGNMMTESVRSTKTEKNPTTLKEYRQKRMMLNARIKYREHNLKGFKQHLKNGTFPKRMKSIKPFPKMDTPEAQAIVNEACCEVNKIILDQMIQEQALKLKQDQESYQTLKKERQQQREGKQNKTHQTKATKKSPMITVVQLQQELKDLQSKYTLLCEKLNSTPTAVKQEPQE